VGKVGNLVSWVDGEVVDFVEAEFVVGGHTVNALGHDEAVLEQRTHGGGQTLEFVQRAFGFLLLHVSLLICVLDWGIALLGHLHAVLVLAIALEDFVLLVKVFEAGV